MIPPQEHESSMKNELANGTENEAEQGSLNSESNKRERSKNVEMKPIEALRIMSPISEMTSSDELGSDPRSEDALWSNGSSTASSSRRLIGNDQMPSLLRAKIRNQAKATLEKKRENIQLGRYQSSHQTLQQDHQEISKNSEDVDRQIEESIKIGAKYTSDRDANSSEDNLTGEILNSEQNINDNGVESSQEVQAEFSKAVMRSAEDTANFSRMCVVYQRKPFFVASAEENFPCVNCGETFLTVGSKLDPFLLNQRFGQVFVSETDDSSKHIIRKPLRIEQPIEEILSFRYSKAENWKTANLHFNYGSYIPLNIIIGSITFTHHWLFSKEDMICSNIRELHSVQTLKANEILKLLREAISEKQRYDDILDPDKEKKNLHAKLELLFSELNEEQQKYIRISQVIGDKWRILEMIRKRQKYSSTTLQVQQMPLDEQYKFDSHMSEFSEFMRSLNETPVYSIYEVEQQLEDKPKEELERLQEVKKIRIQIQIFFNDIAVCKTDFHSFDQRFCVNIGQVYKLQVYEAPESITAIIFEKNSSGEVYELAKLGIPLPDESRLTKLELPLETIQFASDKLVYGHSGSIGSGDEHPCIGGFLYCSASWESARSFQQPNQKKLRTYFSNAEGSCERFELIHKEVRLCSDEKFDYQMRFLMTSGNGDGKNGYMDSFFYTNELQKIKWNIKDTSKANKGLPHTQFDALRLAGCGYVASTRSELCKHFSGEHGAKAFQDIIREEPIPTLFGAFSTIFRGGDTSRKLKPMRKPASTDHFSSNLPYRILINIQSAVNLPVRHDGSLQPFVEVTFQNKSISSKVVGGSNPNWQESMEISLEETVKEKADMEKLSEKLQIFVYDQVVTKLDSDDREPNTVHEQLEKHYLGCVLIPFSTFKINDKIDGYLRIETPLFFSSHRVSENPCYIKMLAMVLPKICSRPRNMAPFTLGTESEQLVARSIQWQNSLTQKFPKRRYVSLVSDPNGQQILASRYLRAIKPPSGLIISHSPQYAKKACRIVSCIPLLSEYSSFNSPYDIWATLDQFLATGCGEEGEHAILLCCWLLAAHIESYVILGTSHLEGDKGAYVLAVFPEILLLNPSSGSVNIHADMLCPLISIGTVITTENIYGNIQAHDHPSQMRFDLKNKHHWVPLITQDGFNIESIQPETLMYNRIDKQTSTELRSNLERAVKVKFDKSRLYGIPQWSLLATRILRGILAEVETLPATADIDKRLAQLKSSYKVNVLILRQRYTSAEEFIGKIMHLNLHNNSDRRAQFALAVHIEPYSSCIIHTIVAVASLCPF